MWWNNWDEVLFWQVESAVLYYQYCFVHGTGLLRFQALLLTFWLLQAEHGALLACKDLWPCLTGRCMHKTVIHYRTHTRKMFSEVQSQQVLPLLACGPESCLGAMWPLLPCGHPVWTLLEVVQNTVMSAEISHSEVPMRNKVYVLPTWFFKNELCY